MGRTEANSRMKVRKMSRMNETRTNKEKEYNNYQMIQENFEKKDFRICTIQVIIYH